MHTPQTAVIAFLSGKEIFHAVLPPGEYVMGRKPGVEIVLDSENVSRRHARLMLNYHDWLIEDLGSSNGTRVGGARIREATLVFPSQRVQVGDVEVELHPVRAAEPDDSPDPQTAAVGRFLSAQLRAESKYEVKGMIGMGGMGAVLEAEERTTRRRVAMKVLLRSGSAENVARFVAEAQITAQLEHPNIIPIYELSVNAQDKPFYTMKLVRGDSLARVLGDLRDGRPEAVAQFSLPELLRVFDKICDAAAFAHAKRIVHRDLKPDNILLGRFGEVLVMDWGLAKPLAKSAEEAVKPSTSIAVDSVRHTDSGLAMTTSGAAVGSPRFMAPEQAAGLAGIDHRADIYALGAILYQMVTLEPSVRGKDPLEILENVVQGRITPVLEALAGRALPHLASAPSLERLAAVTMKALSTEPAHRQSSVKALQAELRAGLR